MAFVQMMRRLLQVRAYKRCVEKGLIKEIVISPDFLKANPEPSRPPRPAQQPVRVEERRTTFSTPPNRVLTRPTQPQRGRELRYIAKGEEEENMEREFTQAEEDMFELQYLASREVERTRGRPTTGFSYARCTGGCGRETSYSLGRSSFPNSALPTGWGSNGAAWYSHLSFG